MEYNVISDDDCNLKLSESYKFNETSAKFCATSKDGRKILITLTYFNCSFIFCCLLNIIIFFFLSGNVHNTNRGAGFFTQFNGRWYLRGIFSMSLLLRQNSRQNGYHLLTNVRGFVNEMSKITEIKSKV